MARADRRRSSHRLGRHGVPPALVVKTWTLLRELSLFSETAVYCSGGDATLESAFHDQRYLDSWPGRNIERNVIEEIGISHSFLASHIHKVAAEFHSRFLPKTKVRLPLKIIRLIATKATTTWRSHLALITHARYGSGMGATCRCKAPRNIELMSSGRAMTEADKNGGIVLQLGRARRENTTCVASLGQGKSLDNSHDKAVP
ncbi:hypothetical protein IW261DRAFT_1418235 [Armillaria novae-zelandiae]|uniref:Uncharacterized protein n=1 Tax=Armillaria novae-zelandiae TaxID=153914 RepID=A0AA39PEE0_9AGAR|nr:hypothetical protein IW261DRAFT_1418235 [Armillaria novae-zelandiae]